MQRMDLLCRVLVIVLTAASISAQDAAGLRETVSENLRIDQQTQIAVEAWTRDESGMRADYQSLKSESQRLRAHLDAESARTEALRRRVREIKRRLQEADRLESGLQDTMLTIYTRLDAAVAADLCFLPEERKRRLDRLETELARPDIPAAEKLRRLLEALQVEAAYGGTVEVYQDDIVVEGQSLVVDILRLGRLSLFWVSPDGKRVGEFDRVAGQWRQLPDKHRRNLRRALEMASRTRSTELLDLPLGRLAP